jgi:hypothetical protein
VGADDAEIDALGRAWWRRLAAPSAVTSLLTWRKPDGAFSSVLRLTPGRAEAVHSPIINKMYVDARRADMLRQARQSQLAQDGASRSRDYERRTFLRRAWFWRPKQSGAVTEAIREVVPEAVPATALPATTRE